MNDIEIGKKAQKIQHIYGFSTDEMADFIGVSKSTIQKYESGNRRIPTDILEKLAKDQLWTIDDIIHGEIPEMDLSQFNKTDIGKIIKYMFPVFQPDRFCEHKEFCSAVTNHLAIRNGLVNPGKKIERDLLDIISDLQGCKKSYSLSIRDSYFKPFALANLVSLSILYAALIDERNLTSRNLMSYYLKRKFKTKPKYVDLYMKGVNIVERNNELHSGTVCKRLWEYIEYLESIEDFKEVAAFLSAFLLHFDIVYPRVEKVQCKILFRQKLDELFDEENPFIIMLFKKLTDAYHIKM